MSDLNNTTLTGRLVRAPLFRNGRTGTAVAIFTIAANQRYQDKTGRRKEETAFVPCKAFGGWAKSLANSQKGDMLLVAGRLRTESWERDDTHQSQLILLCESVFRAANGKVVGPTESEESVQTNGSGVPEANDEIPF